MGVAQVQLYGAQGGEMTCNVLHFFQSDTISADYLDLATRVRDWWAWNPLTLNSPSYQTYNRVKVIPYGVSDAPTELTFSFTGTATTTSDYTPVLAAVLQFRTAIGGRRGRGRTYLGGWGYHQLTNGRWHSAPQLTLSLIAQTLEDFWCRPAGPFYKGNGWVLGVCPRYDPSGFITVDEVIARTTPGCQRRRQLETGA